MNGWLIVGATGGGNVDLDPSEYVGDYDRLPAARNFKPGQWLEWRLAGRQGASVYAACVAFPEQIPVPRP